MGLRWAISLKNCETSPHFELLFRKALGCLPVDEFDRQTRFHHRDNSLACILGQLLIRSCIVKTTGRPWEEVELGKCGRGKPIDKRNEVKFNISHQGDLVVLASSRSRDIGVDVMRIDEERDSTALEHINRLQKLFTSSELQMMRCQRTELDKWRSFYRIWCLKESVLKATGTGLVNDLRKLSFHTSNEKHEPGCFISSTEYEQDHMDQPQFLFEESFVNKDHCVAVARIFSNEQEVSTQRNLLTPTFFEMKTMESLLEAGSPLNTDEEAIGNEYLKFIAKPWKG